MSVEKPNPGSDEARAAGCKCPVMDNNHGKRAPYPPDGWWMHPDCPVHEPSKLAAALDKARSASVEPEGGEAKDLGQRHRRSLTLQVPIAEAGDARD